MYPGAIVLTRILCLAHSLAKLLVNMITAALDVLYAACGCGVLTITPDIDDVLTITPLCCLRNTSPTAFVTNTILFKLTSIVFFQRSYGISSKSTCSLIPALLNKISI